MLSGTPRLGTPRGSASNDVRRRTHLGVPLPPGSRARHRTPRSRRRGSSRHVRRREGFPMILPPTSARELPRRSPRFLAASPGVAFAKGTPTYIAELTPRRAATSGLIQVRAVHRQVQPGEGPDHRVATGPRPGLHAINIHENGNVECADGSCTGASWNPQDRPTADPTRSRSSARAPATSWARGACCGGTSGTSGT